MINLEKTSSLEFQFRNDALLRGWALYLAKSLRGVATEFLQFLWFSQFPSFHTDLFDRFSILQRSSQWFSQFASFNTQLFGCQFISSQFPSFQTQLFGCLPSFLGFLGNRNPSLQNFLGEKLETGEILGNASFPSYFPSCFGST